MGRSRQAVRSCCRHLEERWWGLRLGGGGGGGLHAVPSAWNTQVLEVFWRKRCQGLWLDWPWDWGVCHIGGQ